MVAFPIPVASPRVACRIPSIHAGPSPGGQVLTRETADSDVGGGEGHQVFLFNCDCHSFAQVIAQLLKAVPGMTPALAEELAWRVHTNGLAEVYRGGFEECERVARVLGEIGLIVQVL
jgi:ATP-dependent Clp protease adaptor protein ClpS